MGAEQDDASYCALRFAKGVTPLWSTVHRPFRRLDPAVLSDAVTDRSAADALPGPRGAEGVTSDGKAQRGRFAFSTIPTCPVHALTACSHRQGAALAQAGVVGHAAKVEAELTVAPRLIAYLDWRGRVLTGDALFCQRNICAQVCDAGG